MMKLAVALVAFMAVFTQSEASCPNAASYVKSWNSAKYLGKWYEYSRYSSTNNIFDCVSAEVSKTSSKTVFNVKNTYVSKDGTEWVEVSGQARQTAAPAGIFDVTKSGISGVISYKILNTDYTSYAVVWMCYNNKFDLAIWTRAQAPSNTVIAKANAVIKANNLSKYKMTLIDQKDC